MMLLAQTIDDISRPVEQHGLAIALVVLGVFALFSVGAGVFVALRWIGHKAAGFVEIMVSSHLKFTDAIEKQGEQSVEAIKGIDKRLEVTDATTHATKREVDRLSATARAAAAGLPEPLRSDVMRHLDSK